MNGLCVCVHTSTHVAERERGREGRTAVRRKGPSWASGEHASPGRSRWWGTGRAKTPETQSNRLVKK